MNGPIGEPGFIKMFSLHIYRISAALDCIDNCLYIAAAAGVLDGRLAASFNVWICRSPRPAVFGKRFFSVVYFGQ
jgi:hypothetical protein